jgi:hypothetical protein
VPTIGFNISAYSVVEGDTVTVCASVLCGRLLQNETVMLSITNNAARGYYIKILHAVDEIYVCMQLGLISMPLNK